MDDLTNRSMNKCQHCHDLPTKDADLAIITLTTHRNAKEALAPIADNTDRIQSVL